MKNAFILLLALAVLTGCSEKKQEIPVVDPGFISYISGFTSGVISASSNVVLTLVTDIPETIRTEALEKDLLEIKPSVSGSYSWVDSRTLEFRPSEMLDPGTVYHCKFHLDKLMEVPGGLETLEFQFQTMQQSLFVELEGLNALDDEDLQWQQLKGILKTADYADVEGVEKVLTGRQDGRALKVIWTHNNEGTQHDFTVDSIFRSKEKEEILVSWDGKGIQSEDQGEELVAIPALGDFKLMNVHVRQQPDQYVSLFFSDPISKSQDLRGLVYLESGEEVKLEREGSQLKLYPATRLQGPQKLVVSNAVRNSLDYQLVESYSREIEFSSIHPGVALIGDGVILPGTDGLIFPFKAVNLKAVNVKIVKIFEDNIGQFFQENQYNGDSELKRVGRMILNKEVVLSSDKAIDYGTWNIFSLDLAELIETEAGALYNVSITFNRSQSLLPCAAGDPGEDKKPF
jgi:hypothetical protein